MDAEMGWTGDHPVYDMDWNQEGYMTVTPLPTSIEAPEALEQLREAAGETAATENETSTDKDAKDLSSIEIY